jgi:hypothetical protein
MDQAEQHWVPKSYLMAWCDPDFPLNYEPYVWRFARDGGMGHRKAPKNIFSERDFYTISDPSGQRDLHLEHLLGTLEDKFCQIRETRVARSEELTLEEKVWFCAFVAAMRSRTRGQRKAFQSQWGHALRVAEDLQHSLGAMTQEQRQNYRPHKFLGETSGSSLSIDDVRNIADKPIQYMLPQIIKQDMTWLARMKLVLFTTEDDVGFITSEQPCVWFDPKGGRRPPMLQSGSVEVTMPVSPKCLALLSWEDLPSYMVSTQSLVDNANRFQQMACDEYIVVRRNAIKPIWFD